MGFDKPGNPNSATSHYAREAGVIPEPSERADGWVRLDDETIERVVLAYGGSLRGTIAEDLSAALRDLRDGKLS